MYATRWQLASLFHCKALSFAYSSHSVLPPRSFELGNFFSSEATYDRRRTLYWKMHSELTLAIKYADKNKVAALLSQGADINQIDGYQWTALGLAAGGGHTDIVKLLISQGANINAKCNGNGETALILCSRVSRPNLDIVQMLLEAGSNINDVDNNDETALHHALRQGHLGIASLLIERGADFMANNKNNETPLEIAFQKGHSEIVKSWLKTSGIDVNDRDKTGQTALHIAIKCENSEIVQLLLENHDIDINVMNIAGKTPLHIASEKNLYQEVNWLLMKRGIIVNRKDAKGQTPLHLAAENGFLNIVELLLDAGTDINLCDNMQHSALDLATMNSHPGVANKIESVQLKSHFDQMERENEGWKSRVSKLEIENEKLKTMLMDERRHSEEERLLNQERLEHLQSKLKLKIQEIREETNKTEMKTLCQEQIEYFNAMSCKMRQLENEMEKELDQLKMCAKNNVLDVKFGIPRSPQDQASNNLKKNKEESELEMNEMEREKLLNTIEIVGVEETLKEYLPVVVQSLSLILGTPLHDAAAFYRTSEEAFQVQFLSIESAQSWFTTFKKHREKGKEILASRLNPYLKEVPVSLELQSGHWRLSP